jgi:AraC-like DNA-binding protein
MRYTEFPPSSALARIVRCYWFLEGAGDGRPEPILPDGRPEIAFHLGARFERHAGGRQVNVQPAAMIVGQLTAPMTIAHRGLARVAAVRLHPAALRSVVRCEARELTEDAFDLEAVLGRTGELQERLAHAPCDSARAALLDAWLRKIVRAGPRDEVATAVSLIESRRGAVSLRALSRHVSVGPRHLERAFRRDVGIAPKTLARLARLQHALGRISTGAPLASIALECGYYDQPHMTRDFALLADTSPAEWRQNAGVLTPLFVSR